MIITLICSLIFAFIAGLIVPNFVEKSKQLKCETLFWLLAVFFIACIVVQLMIWLFFKLEVIKEKQKPIDVLFDETISLNMIDSIDSKNEYPRQEPVSYYTKNIIKKDTLYVINWIEFIAKYDKLVKNGYYKACNLDTCNYYMNAYRFYFDTDINKYVKLYCGNFRWVMDKNTVG